VNTVQKPNGGKAKPVTDNVCTLNPTVSKHYDGLQY